MRTANTLSTIIITVLFVMIIQHYLLFLLKSHILITLYTLLRMDHNNYLYHAFKFFLQKNSLSALYILL